MSRSDDRLWPTPTRRALPHYAEFVHHLIAQARKVYANESLGMELANTVYALDSTTIDLCLSLFPWAHFRSTKAAVKMHTLLDLRGIIPSFVHISTASCTTFTLSIC